MEIKNYFAQDAQGNIMPSANCYLYLPGTTTLATGLVDGNGTPISNPFLASSVGQVEFGAPNGVYDLRVALGARDWTIKVQCADIVQAMDVMDSILGPHAANPSTRNNGQPLDLGDETWNSTDKQPYWWDGSSWLALNSSAQQLEESLASNTLVTDGAAKIALFGEETKLDAILRDKVFPGITLEKASTSWAGIVSSDINEDVSDELANFLELHRLAEFDTQMALNKSVQSLRARTEIHGAPGCNILNGPDMAQKVMLSMRGSDSVVRRLRMDNPLELKANTGGRQTAIDIRADNVTIEENHFYRMLHCVTTESTGEWYMPKYLRNVAFECIGTGAGPSDDGTTGFGEDRGDAFTIWGATGVMEGNFAFCKAGQDARIAFHCESLGSDYHTRPNNPARDGFDYWMKNNYAFGGFRRHFALEAVDRAIMLGNISGGGATWWAVAITGCNDVVASNMVLLYDRLASNTAGAAWSPERAAIAVGHNGSNIALSQIIARFAPSAVGAGFTSLVTNNTCTGVTFDHVKIIKPVGQGGLGFVMDKLPDFKSNSCEVIGAQHGLTTFGAQDCQINDFSCYDLTGDAVRATGGGGGIIARTRVKGGHFERVGRVFNGTNLTEISYKNTTSKGVTGNDFEQFGTTGPITIAGNHNENGTGKLAGLGSPFTAALVRNIGDNIGYTNDSRFAIACFTDATSALNTNGKYTGKRVMRSDGVMMVALGNLPTSPWGIVTTTAVTPA